MEEAWCGDGAGRLCFKKQCVSVPLVRPSLRAAPFMQVGRFDFDVPLSAMRTHHCSTGLMDGPAGGPSDEISRDRCGFLLGHPRQVKQGVQGQGFRPSPLSREVSAFLWRLGAEAPGGALRYWRRHRGISRLPPRALAEYVGAGVCSAAVRTTDAAPSGDVYPGASVTGQWETRMSWASCKRRSPAV